jgi:hypothetical protein
LRHTHFARTSHRIANRLASFADQYRLKTRISEDDTRIVPGKFGHLYLYDDGVLGVMVIPDPPREHYWGHVRTAMLRAGFVVVQDGDGEGAATFDPTNPQQVELAIRAAGIKRKRRLSQEQREKLIARLRASARRALCTSETTIGAGGYIPAHLKQKGSVSRSVATQRVEEGGMR